MKGKKNMGKYATGILVLAAGIAFGVGMVMTTPEAEAETVVVYKSPTCGCCGKWVDHLRDNGFQVMVKDRADMVPVKDELGVPFGLRSCHTAKVGGYVVEGHVPADQVKRLLDEKPDVAGLAVPGMPMGSPGMEGPRKDPYEVIAFRRDGGTRVYARR